MTVVKSESGRGTSWTWLFKLLEFDLRLTAIAMATSRMAPVAFVFVVLGFVTVIAFVEESAPGVKLNNVSVVIDLKVYLSNTKEYRF